MYRATVICDTSGDALYQWDQMEPIEDWKHQEAEAMGYFIDICRIEIEPAFSDLLGVRQHVVFELEGEICES